LERSFIEARPHLRTLVNGSTARLVELPQREGAPPNEHPSDCSPFGLRTEHGRSGWLISSARRELRSRAHVQIAAKLAKGIRDTIWTPKAQLFELYREIPYCTCPQGEKVGIGWFSPLSPFALPPAGIALSIWISGLGFDARARSRLSTL
jgi:hypothetical protein